MSTIVLPLKIISPSMPLQMDLLRRHSVHSSDAIDCHIQLQVQLNLKARASALKYEAGMAAVVC
jgi:hypothetical protein